MTILDQLAAHARERVARDQERVDPETLARQAERLGPGEGAAFATALKKPGLSLICEVKRASPSKGLIAPEFPYRRIARDYEAGGADCVSCLTEPKWFLGSDEIFQEIRQEIRLPMIRKDFTVDPYQLDQARVMGANAVLLICALLDTAALRRYLARCRQLGLAALVETHDETEIESALEAGAEIIGVNNRNLNNFTVDFSNASRLRTMIPSDRIFVAESGVQGLEDLQRLSDIGADAALVGEALMRAPDRVETLRGWKGSI